MGDETLSETIAADLDVSERLLAFGALTNGDVLTTLNRAYDYVQLTEPTDGNEELLKAIVIPELRGEIRQLQATDYAAPLNPQGWPRERRAIERAYGFADSHLIDVQAEADAAQARKDALDNVLDRAGDAGKSGLEGLGSIVSGVIILVLLLIVSQVAGKARS